MSQAAWAIIGVAVIVLWSAIKVVREYERLVVFRLGRLVGTKGPGLVLIIPIMDRFVKVDLRIVTMDVPSQELITRDNVPAKVNAVVYFKVMDANLAVVQVANFILATSQIAQTTLRSTLGSHELDDLLSERDKINRQLQEVIDAQTDPWGIKVTTVEIKEVELPEGMRRAMARQAEAERERRAKIINAQGEFQAAERLAQAADIIGRHPAALQLRFLQTLTEVSSERNSTILFPLPIDLIKPFTDLASAVARNLPAAPAPVEPLSAPAGGIDVPPTSEIPPAK
jgi:regulator of protease activity HflC (stomatin/prohibitin superfamily)